MCRAHTHTRQSNGIAHMVACHCQLGCHAQVTCTLMHATLKSSHRPTATAAQLAVLPVPRFRPPSVPSASARSMTKPVSARARTLAYDSTCHALQAHSEAHLAAVIAMRAAPPSTESNGRARLSPFARRLVLCSSCIQLMVRSHSRVLAIVLAQGLIARYGRCSRSRQ